MMLKHVIAVDDLIRLYETDPSKLRAKVVEEKIGDYINYLILMEGLFVEVVLVSKSTPAPIIVEEEEE